MVCKNENGKASVEHYYLNGNLPELINATDASMGISNARVRVDQGFMICEFSRKNAIANIKYYDVNNNEAYILTAFGNMLGGKYFKWQDLL